MTTIPEKPFYRPREVAEIFDVSVGIVYRWVRLNQIRHVRAFGRIRIPHAEVERIATANLVFLG